MKIKDLPTEIQEYLFYELQCQHAEYNLDSEILDVLNTNSTDDGRGFWLNINDGNFMVFFNKFKNTKKFKVGDLKTGMCVVLSSGEVGVVFKEYFANNRTYSGILLSNTLILSIEDYDDNLMFIDPSVNKIIDKYSIDEVYVFTTLHHALERNTRFGKKIWEREIPEYTMGELYDKIGHRFTIKE